MKGTGQFGVRAAGRGLAMVFALCLAHELSAYSLITTKIEFRDDRRAAVLAQFFTKRASPLAHLAPDFVAAADRYGLDWRLLPSIALVESGGGKNYTNRNIFGWKNGNAKFDSIRTSIHYVASRFARSPLYAGKSMEGILRTYNPVRADYQQRVMWFFQRLPVPETRTFASVPAPGLDSKASPWTMGLRLTAAHRRPEEPSPATAADWRNRGATRQNPDGNSPTGPPVRGRPG